MSQLSTTTPVWGEPLNILLFKAVQKLADDTSMSQYAPKLGDTLNVLMYKLCAIIDGGNFSGGGGGGATADNALAATTLAGLKALDTVTDHSVGDYIFTQFAGEAVKMRVLKAGSTNSDPDQVRPNDYDAGTNDVFWQTEM